VKKREHLFESGKEYGSLCVKCKGEKLLCGKSSCPILLKYYSMIKYREYVKEDLQGSSPPSIFVGHRNYPKVNVGPLSPPFQGDTEIMDYPEKWWNINIKEFVDMRFSLVRAKYRIDVHDVESRYSRSMHELILSERPVYVEEEFLKKPGFSIPLNDEVQPYGPSGDLKSIYISNSNTDRKVEKIYEDRDMNARDAIFQLYRENIPVSKIQRIMSAGMIGIGKFRKFVPTRWAITAVDSTISEIMLDEIKSYESIDTIKIFESNFMENRFIVAIFPGSWSYELVEAWYPGTLWNPFSNNTYIISDHEFYYGRKDYAEIGGCYYSARLAVSEYLKRIGRQGRVVVLREAQPSYIMPVGVWNVRENVRKALNGNASEFNDFDSALNYIFSRFHIEKSLWMKNSKILDFIKHQRGIESFEMH